MDKIASSRFRAAYASLENEMMVTVNGHPIGIWKPIHLVIEQVLADTIQVFESPPREPRPIRPVPKPSKRR